MIVSIDRERGRVMILDKSFGVPLVREDGAWRVDTFSADDLKDYIYRVTDPEEAEALFQEAVAAVESNPGLGASLP